MDKSQHLTLVAECEDDVIRFDPPPTSLRLQPQRPGELTELVDIPIDESTAEKLHAESPIALPDELALYIAVEAERSLAEASELFGFERAELALHLDEVALDIASRAPRHILVRSLGRYANALEHGIGQRDPFTGAVRARVPHHVAARWAHSAAAEGQSLDDWLAELAIRASGTRVSWEAAAARSGRTVSEWVLVHAARSARSRKTVPHTAASA